MSKRPCDPSRPSRFCWEPGCAHCDAERERQTDRPDNKANVMCTEDNWLIKIAEVPVNSVGYVLNSRLDRKTAQDACDAQYGKNVFTVSKHGTHFYFWRRHPDAWIRSRHRYDGQSTLHAERDR